MEDMKNAMRSGDSIKRDTVRFLMSAIKNFEIDNGAQPDEGILKIIAKEVKKMEDALVDFAKGDRQDLIDAEKPKIEILKNYLPKQLTAEELAATVKKVIEDLGKSDFGTTMKAVMAKVGTRADGGTVSAAVKKHLA